MRLIANNRITVLFLFFLISNWQLFSQTRTETSFNNDWYFILDSTSNYSSNNVDYSEWRNLNLPHDWSVEGHFDRDNPSNSGGAYLPGGIGWYKKCFDMDYDSTKVVSIVFDGVYERSEVWINGHHLGVRPNGFIRFSYDLSKYLNKNGKGNILTVKADNSLQPNTRFYTGSGIYRPVTLITTGQIHIADPFVFTGQIDATQAVICLEIPVFNSSATTRSVQILTEILDPQGEVLRKSNSTVRADVPMNGSKTIKTSVEVPNPILWSPENPELYRVRNTVSIEGEKVDIVETKTGLRYFNFDAKTGFWLNGINMKIRGVCLHSDQGALGTAFNKDATLRQLKILKTMGVNGIRNAHNPAASGFLDLCDSLGFIVMNETFDVWKNKKNPYDYHLYWDKWFERDLADQIINDRNHPSIFIWCLGNEVQEQWHSLKLGKAIPKRLAEIVDSLDGTRPTTIANNEISIDNPVLMTDAVDIIGYNYNEQKWRDAPKMHRDKAFIITESVSALETRGQYDLLAMDSVRTWPERWDIPFNGGNSDRSISAYDHVHTPWGSTHERSLFLSERMPWVSGIYIWTGFDYLGEPTPYTWPSRSSYFGIVDLAGFPKDVYYLYQSEWTNTPVLHLLPHWNWSEGDTVDVVAYYNNADRVELFLNGESLGFRSKADSSLHVRWRVPFQAGELRAVSTKEGKAVKETLIHTAGTAASLHLYCEQDTINGIGGLAFIHAELHDAQGNLVPRASDVVKFRVRGNGQLVATDNGNPADVSDFSSPNKKLLNGKGLAIVRATEKVGSIVIIAKVKGLPHEEIEIVIDSKPNTFN